MDWIQSAISDFGSSIGLPGLNLDAGRLLRLRTGTGGGIEFHHLQDERGPALLLAYSEPAPYDMADRIRKACQRADFRRGARGPLQVAALNNQLILATRLPERAVSQAALDETLAWLRDLHEQLRIS